MFLLLCGYASTQPGIEDDADLRTIPILQQLLLTAQGMGMHF